MECMNWVALASNDWNKTWPLCAAKQARLKQAKEEAEKEIAEFRAQVEADFQRKVLEVRVERSIWERLHGKLFTWCCGLNMIYIATLKVFQKLGCNVVLGILDYIRSTFDFSLPFPVTFWEECFSKLFYLACVAESRNVSCWITFSSNRACMIQHELDCKKSNSQFYYMQIRTIDHLIKNSSGMSYCFMFSFS